MTKLQALKDGVTELREWLQTQPQLPQNMSKIN